MIKNLTKLGCHLVCWTCYLKIAHYLPHLIFWELTSLCRNRFNDQRTHLFGILPCVGVRIAGISLLPFLFVINHHLAAASGEVGLKVTSAVSEMIVTSATLIMAPGGGVAVSLSLSLLTLPLHGQSVTNPNLSFSLHLSPPPYASCSCCPRWAHRAGQHKNMQPCSHPHPPLASVAPLEHSLGGTSAMAPHFLTWLSKPSPL